MKTIKINFSGFWNGFAPEKFCVYELLQKHYNVEISDSPDYVFCSVFDHHSYVNIQQIRILFSGENYIPDLNLVDYGISVYPLSFLDRHMSFPGLAVSSLDSFWELQNKKREYTEDFLKTKTLFANMIASHDSDNGIRTRLFDMLTKYKRVEAPGELRYNIMHGERVYRHDGSKRELQQKCKFTLCSESTCEGGFITEKIFEAFCADTIPVYLGSSTVCEHVNKNAFINIADYDDLQDVVDRIIELDKNDEKYLEMLRQPIFVRSNYVQEKVNELERFLCNIFDQPLEKAGRRATSFHPKAYEKIVSLGGQGYVEEQRDLRKKKAQRQKRKEFWRYLPQRILLFAVGENRYKQIKNSFKKNTK